MTIDNSVETEVNETVAAEGCEVAAASVADAQAAVAVKKTFKKSNKHKSVSYAKWGYIFIAPFFIVYTICSLIPLLMTFYYSFFEYFESINFTRGPTWVGFDNFVWLFEDANIMKYFGNTMVIWIIGFIPQMIVALLLALFFTSYRLKIKGQGFFKTVLYMPNMIMATAIALLFNSLFSDAGPINKLLLMCGVVDTPYRFLTYVGWTRGLIGFMNFMLWFGHTSILLMAGIMGIDKSLFEAAAVDGASPVQVLFKVTLPLLMPIMVYVMLTSVIGGVQMFDIADIFTEGGGNPNMTSYTLIMFLNLMLGDTKSYGRAGALSVLLFVVTAVVGLVVYRILMKQYRAPKIKRIKLKNNKEVEA